MDNWVEEQFLFFEIWMLVYCLLIPVYEPSNFSSVNMNPDLVPLFESISLFLFMFLFGYSSASAVVQNCALAYLEFFVVLVNYPNRHSHFVFEHLDYKVPEMWLTVIQFIINDDLPGFPIKFFNV